MTPALRFLVVALIAVIGGISLAAAQDEQRVRRAFYDHDRDGTASFLFEGVAGGYETRLAVAAEELAAHCRSPAEIIAIEEEGVIVCGRRQRRGAECVGGVFVRGRMRCNAQENTQ